MLCINLLKEVIMEYIPSILSILFLVLFAILIVSIKNKSLRKKKLQDTTKEELQKILDANFNDNSIHYEGVISRVSFRHGSFAKEFFREFFKGFLARLLGGRSIYRSETDITYAYLFVFGNNKLYAMPCRKRKDTSLEADFNKQITLDSSIVRKVKYKKNGSCDFLLDDKLHLFSSTPNICFGTYNQEETVKKFKEFMSNYTEELSASIAVS